MAAVNLTDLFTEHGVKFRASGSARRRGWLEVDCPNCHGPNYAAFNINNGAASCWRCGPTKAADLLAALIRTTPEAAWRLLGGPQQRPTPLAKPPGKLTLPPGVGLLQAAHVRYLRGRGLDPDTMVRLWGLQGIGVAARLQWRIFIPIRNGRGDVVSWTTRSINPDAGLRYISAAEDQEAIPHKSLLYGAEYARHAVIVVEGPADVWALGPGSVATFGVTVSPAQIAAISRYPVRFICYDYEPAAQRRADVLSQQLSPFPGETHILRLDDASDPGSATDEQIAEIRSLCLGV